MRLTGAAQFLVLLQGFEPCSDTEPIDAVEDASDHIRGLPLRRGRGESPTPRPRPAVDSGRRADGVDRARFEDILRDQAQRGALVLPILRISWVLRTGEPHRHFTAFL